MPLKRQLSESRVYITNVINPYTWLMAWQWCHFLLASYRSVTTDCLCQIALNQKLSCKFKKLCKFSRRVKAKSPKMQSRETRAACIMVHQVAAYGHPCRSVRKHPQSVCVILRLALHFFAHTTTRMEYPCYSDILTVTILLCSFVLSVWLLWLSHAPRKSNVQCSVFLGLRQWWATIGMLELCLQSTRNCEHI
jgi:hypothetical protein